MAYIIKRIMMIIPILICVSIISFSLLKLTPGDPAQVMLGSFASEERVAELREKLGLDRPILIQYWSFFTGIFRGDLGTSYITGDSVIKEIMSRFPATFELTTVSMFFAIIIAVILGIISAIKRNSAFDIISTTTAVIGMATPAFWLGLLLMYFFSIKLNILPLGGRIDLGISLEHYTNIYILDSIISSNFLAFKNVIRHLILPAIVMAIYPVAEVSQIVRSNMIDVLNQDYIRTAKAKGLTNRQVNYKHALKNALIPVITVVGIRLGKQFAGALIVEVIFSWPGIGRLAFNAIQSRDFPVIQGTILFIALIFIVLNLIVDTLYVFIDPRIKFI